MQRGYNKQADCLRKHLCKLLEIQIKWLFFVQPRKKRKKKQSRQSCKSNLSGVCSLLKSLAQVKLTIRKEGHHFDFPCGDVNINPKKPTVRSQATAIQKSDGRESRIMEVSFSKGVTRAIESNQKSLPWREA